jgi:hypothetical protein
VVETVDAVAPVAVVGYSMVISVAVKVDIRLLQDCLWRLGVRVWLGCFLFLADYTSAQRLDCQT